MMSSITDMINNIAVYMQYLLYAVTASIPRKEESKKISNDQEQIQSDPISCPQTQKGNN